ncbi:hypothetical protein FOA52_003643 [Chlamydomonas sp. UWO 241]|nr:hypothetical protein FOA52_003643 [Chlamydomonas sp. UWO 241]
MQLDDSVPSTAAHAHEDGEGASLGVLASALGSGSVLDLGGSELTLSCGATDLYGLRIQNGRLVVPVGGWLLIKGGLKASSQSTRSSEVTLQGVHVVGACVLGDSSEAVGLVQMEDGARLVMKECTISVADAPSGSHPSPSAGCTACVLVHAGGWATLHACTVANASPGPGLSAAGARAQLTAHATRVDASPSPSAPVGSACVAVRGGASAQLSGCSLRCCGRSDHGHRGEGACGSGAAVEVVGQGSRLSLRDCVVDVACSAAVRVGVLATGGARCELSSVNVVTPGAAAMGAAASMVVLGAGAGVAPGVAPGAVPGSAGAAAAAPAPAPTTVAAAGTGASPGAAAALGVEACGPGTRLVARDCRVDGFAPGALRIDGGATAQLEGCSFVGSCGGPGVTLSGGGSVAGFERCVLARNAGPGIEVCDGAHGELLPGCEVARNASAGAVLVAGPGSRLLVHAGVDVRDGRTEATRGGEIVAVPNPK